MFFLKMEALLHISSRRFIQRQVMEVFTHFWDVMFRWSKFAQPAPIPSTQSSLPSCFPLISI